MISDNEVLIGPHNSYQYSLPPMLGGELKSFGLIPRDLEAFPLGCYRGIKHYSGVDIPEIPEGDWTQIIKDRIAAKAQLSDIRMFGMDDGSMIPSRDQNGKGYCWQHSGVGALIVTRAVQHQPYADLSAYGPACIQKSFRDEGGWGAAGVDFLVSRGCPTSKTWPQKSMSRSNDNPQTWEEAKLYRITEGFIDLQAAQYDRKLSRSQIVSLLLSGIPVVGDFNWWGHSVCMLDVVDGVSLFNQGLLRQFGKIISMAMFDIMFSMNDEMGGYGTRIWNSWGDEWSDKGMGVLTGSKAWPDGAVAPRSASVAPTEGRIPSLATAV